MPSTAKALPRSGPLLVVAPRDASFELRTTAGRSQPLAPSLALPLSGICGFDIVLLAPEDPLVPDTQYLLATETTSGITESAPFVAAEQNLQSETVQIEVTATLEPLEPDEVGLGSCSDRALHERLIHAHLHVQVAAPLTTPVIVTASVQDEISGSLTTSDVAFNSAGDGSVYSTLPLPIEASTCVEVEIRDLTATSFFRELLCPEVDRPATRSLTAKLARLPDPPPPAPATASAGAGCSFAKHRDSSGTSRPWWLLAPWLAVWRRRRAPR